MEFKTINSALKRANTFASNKKTDRRIACHNYCWLLTSKKARDSKTEEVMQDICILDMWANSIDRWCSNNMINDSPEMQYELHIFKKIASRLKIDFSKL